MRSWNTFTALLVVAATGGCVSTGKYDAALADAQRAQTELNATRGELGAVRADSKRQLAAKQAELDELNQVISQAQARCRRIADEVGVSRSRATRTINPFAARALPRTGSSPPNARCRW